MSQVLIFSLVAAVLVGIVAYFILYALSALAPGEGKKSSLSIRIKSWLLLIISLLPGVILAQTHDSVELFNLITFQAGVTFNFWLSALLGVAIGFSLITINHISSYADGEERNNLMSNTRLTLKQELVAVAIWGVIVALLGGGGTGVGIALIGFVVGGVFAPLLFTDESRDNILATHRKALSETAGE